MLLQGSCHGPSVPAINGVPTCQQGSPPLLGSPAGLCSPPLAPQVLRAPRRDCSRAAGSWQLPGSEEEEQEKAEAMAHGASQQCLRLHITQCRHLGSSPLLASAKNWRFLVQGLQRLLMHTPYSLCQCPICPRMGLSRVLGFLLHGEVRAGSGRGELPCSPWAGAPLLTP